MTQRRWRLLLILATHGGWCTTADVQALIGISPVTVHRDLTALRKAGLLQRKTIDEDRSHRWIYTTTAAGQRQVAEVLERAGLEVPANLGRGAGHRAMRLLVLLSEVSHFDGIGQVLVWRSGADVASWLRHRHGIDGVQADAYGVWAEEERAVRFLVQVDEYHVRKVVDRLLDQLSAPAGVVLPVNAVLLIADKDAEEEFVHNRLRDAPTAVVVATTTEERMYGPDGPAGAIWSTADVRSRYLRLIELASPHPIK